jgi:hypothetical protein
VLWPTLFRSDPRKPHTLFAELMVSLCYWFCIAALFGLYSEDSQLVNNNGVVLFEVFKKPRITRAFFCGDLLHTNFHRDCGYTS